VEVDISGPVGAFVAGAPRRVRLGLRVALLVVEHGTGLRRFSRASAAARLRRLKRLEASHGLRRDLFLLLKGLATLGYGRDPGVRDRLGIEQRCRTAGDAPPPQRLVAAPPDGDESCDVVVVGSGAGGAAAARVLAEAGLSVVVLEEGEHHDRGSYSADPLEALPMLYRDSGLTACEGRPVIPLPVGRCVGGTTVINSGTVFRAPEDVLVAWRDEHGIDWAPDLAGEFEALERDLRVAPVDPATAGRNAELCRAGAEAIDAANGPLLRNAGDVTCCGTCPMGCELDAKQAAHVSELPRACAAGAVVRPGVRVTEVIVENGRAVGVRGRAARNGGTYEARSRAVVLAGGALGTPELLLRQGLANSSGEVGRRLRIHPACWVGARFDEEVRGWDGVMQSWHVGEWQSRGLFLEATFTPFAFGAHWLPGAGDEFMRRVERYADLAIIGVHLSDRSEGRLRVRGGALRIGYRLTDDDAARLRFGIARAADIHFAAGAREVYPQVGALPVLEPGEQRHVENGRFRPADLRLEAFHPMGTVRMGSDPGGSVVSPSGESHDVPGLFVADASLFPSSLRVNPMLTVMACARRVARGLADRLG
jgi:choline dehydrogenase-like flavoprotein